MLRTWVCGTLGLNPQPIIASPMRTHYDVLHLGKNCSAKEIKDSFLKLSKIYHPDRNKQADAHSKFVEVNEAYSVLGKTVSRLRYDESLCAQARTDYRTYGASAHNMRTYEDLSNMYAKERGNDTGAVPLIRSKIKVICFCIVLIFLGTGLRLTAYQNQRYMHSHRIAQSLQETKEKMKMNKELNELLRKTADKKKNENLKKD